MNVMRQVIFLALVLAPTVVGRGDEAYEAKRARRENDVVRAIRASKEAVVNISTTVLMSQEDENDIFQFFKMPDIFPQQQVPSHSLGSGFIIHKDGYIVTNAHVVQRANEVTVSFADKTTAKAQAVYADFEHDLAVIKIRPPKPLHVLPLGRGNDLMIGETVIAIGNPLGYEHTVTVGVVSAVNRTLNFSRGQTYRNLIQTDASINPGNSGGPLLDVNGELIGINTAIRGDAQNIGFAINVQALHQILPDLLNPENIRRINLGFRLSSDSEGRVHVMALSESSPAYHAGMKADDIVVGFDGKRFKSPVDLYVGLLERAGGAKLTLDILRGERRVEVTVPFEVKPKPNGLALAKRHLGMTLAVIPAEQAQSLGLSETPLLMVEHVTPGGPAAQMGIRKGDIVYQLDRYRIDSLDQVAQILDNARRGRPINAVIIRARGGAANVYRVTLKMS